MDRGSTPLSSTNASSLGSKRSKKQGVRHKCHSLFLWLAPCLALRSVPLMGTEIVTRLYLDISISRHSLSAIAIPSRTLSAPYNSPQLHHATEVGSSAGFRSFLRGDAVGSAPLLLAFVKQTGCTLARHDTLVSWRPPTWALAVRQLPSAPPALRATAQRIYISDKKTPLLIFGAQYFVISIKLLYISSRGSKDVIVA